jgi:hypothetical protein
MQKGQLQQWGQAMMGIGLLACGTFSGLAVTVYATFLAFVNAPSLRQTFPNEPIQIIWLLVKGGFLVGIAIVLLAGVFKAITCGAGLFLIWLDDFIFYERPAKLTIRGKQVYLGEKTEYYVEIKNRYWSNIDVCVTVLMQIKEGQSYLSHEQFIKWSGVKSHNPVVTIKTRKTKLLHFASVRDNGNISINMKSNTSMPVSPNPDGHIFSLTAVVDDGKFPKPKEKDFDIVVSYNDDGKPEFKIKRVRRNEKRHYIEP